MKSSSRFILVCLFVLVLLASFLLSPDSVLAAVVRQATMTATNTTVPTPTSQFGVVCPVGTPIGWGTFTPSALWNLTCSSCLTPTAYPTNTFEPTITSTVGVGTPTVTAFPTITPTPSASCNEFTGQLITPIITMERNSLVSEDLVCINYGGLIHCEGDIVTTDVDTFDGYVWVQFDVENVTDTTVYWSPPISNYVDVGGSHTDDELAGYAGFTANQVHPIGNTSVLCDTAINTQMICTLDSATHGFTFYLAYLAGGGVGNNTTVSLDFDMYVDPSCSEPPTITPTPTLYVDDTFCGSINDLPSFGWDLIIEDGPPNCDFGWDEFTVGSYTVPAVQICLQPVQVGVITLFGVVYEMGVFFLAAGAAFFWRFFRTV